MNVMSYSVEKSTTGKAHQVQEVDQRRVALIMYESAAPTMDMTVLPGVLEPRTLRRTVQVGLGFESLRLLGGTAIFKVARHRFIHYKGYKKWWEAIVVGFSVVTGKVLNSGYWMLDTGCWIKDSQYLKFDTQ
jgi:hypothetical protein